MDTFKSKKHRKKVNHMIIFTSDAVDGKVHRLRLTPVVFYTSMIALCILLGVVAGYFIYGGTLFDELMRTQQEQAETIATLTEEKALVELENEKLTEKVAILSETVNQKVQAEQEQEAINEEMSIPTEFPLTGSAQVTETDTVQALADMLYEAGGAVIQTLGDTNEEEKQPICIFKASEGTTAVAAGHGVVTQVSEDVNYGYRITIDHENGYKTIYLNQGEPKVKEGNSVNRGDTLFVIGSDNTTMGYQMLQDDVFINPMDMIAING